MIEGNKICNSCIYKKVWDCKNCFMHTQTSNSADKANLLITLVLTRQCNFRCNYCTIDFNDDNVSYETLNILIEKIYRERARFGVISIEFFGGEPTLEFEKIRYVVENTKNLDIRYTTYSNGHLFNDEMIKFFNENKFGEVVFSVSSHNMNNLLPRYNFFKNNILDNIVVNLILEPSNENKTLKSLAFLIKVGFKKFSLIPVHHSKKWSSKQLIGLNYLLNQIHILYNKLKNSGLKLKINNFSTNFDEGKYGVKEDIELLIDFNGKIYADTETELRLLKDFVGKDILDIEKLLIGNLEDENLLLTNLIEIRKGKAIKIMESLNIINAKLDVAEDLIGTGSILNKYKFN